MANFFDQFDPPEKSGGNFFDQFDEPQQTSEGNFFDQFDTLPDKKLPSAPREDFIKRIPGLGKSDNFVSPSVDQKVINGKTYRLGRDSGLVFDDKNKIVDDPAIRQAFGLEAALTSGDYAAEAGKAAVRGAANTVGGTIKGAALATTSDPKAVAEIEQGITNIRSMPYEEAEAFRKSIKDRVRALNLNPLAAVNYEAALRATWRGDTETAKGYLETARTYSNTGAVKDQPIYQAGQALTDEVRKDFPQDPRFADSWWSTIFEGAGSTVPFVPAGFAGPGTVAGLGALASGSEGYDSARRDIEGANRDKNNNAINYRDDRGGLYNAGYGSEAENVARRAGQASMLPGLSEAAPIELLVDQTIGRIPFFKTPAGAKLWERGRSALLRIGAQVLAEGGQEGFQTWANNIINRIMVDPSQSDWENVATNAAVGGIVGGGMQVGAEAIGAVTGRGEQAPPPPEPPPPAAPVDPQLFPGTPPATPPSTTPGASPPPAGPQPTPTNPVVTGASTDDYLLADGYSPEQIADMTPDEKRAALDGAIARGAQPAQQASSQPAPSAPPAAETPPSASAGPAQAAPRHPPGPATWANADFDQPVNILDEPPQQDPASGKWFQRIEDGNGGSGFVPFDELQPQARTAPAPGTAPRAPRSGKSKAAPRAPHQMTRQQFNDEAAYQGISAITDESTPSYWFTDKPEEAAQFATAERGDGRFPQLTEPRIDVALKSDLGAEWNESGRPTGSRHAYTGAQKHRPVVASVPISAAADPHRYLVEQALARGEEVPPEVLADYPDLAPQQTAPEDDFDALLNDAIAQEFGPQQAPAPADPAVINRQFDEYLAGKKPLTQEAFAKHAKISVEEAGKALQRAHLAGRITPSKNGGYRRPPTRVAPLDALDYLASKGGVSDPTGELRGMDLHKAMTQYGPVVRKTGMHPDKARELLVEAGYMRDAGRDSGGQATSTVADFYDLMDRAARGEKIYVQEDQAKAAGIDAERRNRDLKPDDWEDLHPIELRYGPDVWNTLQQTLAAYDSYEEAWSQQEINDMARFIADGMDPETAVERAAIMHVDDLREDEDIAPEITAAFERTQLTDMLDMPPFPEETTPNAAQLQEAPEDRQGVRPARAAGDQAGSEAETGSAGAQVRDAGEDGAEAGGQGPDAGQNFAGEFDGVSNDDFIANIESRIAAGENDVYIAPTSDGPEFRSAMESRGWRMGRFGKKGKAFYSPNLNGYLFYDAAVAGNRLNVQFSPLKQKDMADYPDFVTGKESAPETAPRKTQTPTERWQDKKPVTPIDYDAIPNPVNDKTVNTEATPDERLILMACGAEKAKLAKGEKVKPIDLYTGAMYQVLKKWMPKLDKGKVVILSAKHGIVPGTGDMAEFNKIESYDERMTPKKAKHLVEAGIYGNWDDFGRIKKAATGLNAHAYLRPDGRNAVPYKDVFIAGGGEYRKVFHAYITQMIEEGLISPDASINEVTGGIGEQRGQLGEYLRKIAEPAKTAEPKAETTETSLDQLEPQDQVRVTLREPIEEKGQSFGPVLEGEYMTQAGMHFVAVKGKGLLPTTLGPIDADNVVKVELTKSRAQVFEDRYNNARGEAFGDQLTRTRDGYEKWLRSIAAAIADAKGMRRLQLEQQMNDVADEIGLAQKKRKWLVAEAAYRKRGGTAEYPSRMNLAGESQMDALNLQRPKPSDFEPAQEARRTRSDDSDPASPKAMIRRLQKEGFGAFPAASNPDGDPENSQILVTMPGGKENGRAILTAKRGAQGWRYTVATYGASSAAQDQRERKMHASPAWQKLTDIIREAHREEAAATTEKGADNKQQLVIPGAERDQKGALRIAANKPMRAATYQKPMDEGLFGSERDQTDLFDAPKPKDTTDRRDEAWPILDELEKIDLTAAQSFAKGMRSALEGMPAITADSVAFYRQKLADFKAQAAKAGEVVEKPAEGRTLESSIFDNPAEVKLIRTIMDGDLLASGPMREADRAYQKLAAWINDKGFKVNDINSFNASPEIQKAKNLLSSLAGAAVRVAKSQDARSKGYERGSIDRLSSDISQLRGETIAADQFVGTDETSIDDALEAALEQELGTKPKPKVSLQGNWWEPLMGGEEKPKKPKTAGEAAKSAAKNTAMGIKDVAQGLQTLFGDKNKLSSGFTFDEDTYRQALPYFKAGAAHLKNAAADMKELAIALVRALKGAGMTADAIEAMKPYLKRFMQDIRDGKETLDAPGSSEVLEPDRGDAAAGDAVGGADVPAAAGAAGPGAGARGEPAGEGNGRPDRRRRVPQIDAPVVGAEGNLELPAREPGAAGGTSPAGQPVGSSQGGDARLPDDRVPAQEAAAVVGKAANLSLEERVKRQKAAETIPTKPRDLENIRATLPVLTKEQQEDVLKIEERHNAKDGHGVLVTNGTGTGKTFTGLGAVKRFARQGKTNILIVAPSQGILLDWQKAAKLVGLDIHILESTQDKGKGISATTYANLGDNRTLADRAWDLIVTDESHKLSSDQNGTPTAALKALRAITLHPDGMYERGQMLFRKEWEAYERLKPTGRNPSGDQIRAADEAYRAWKAKYDGAKGDWAKLPRSKVVMLSATPFAYHFSLDYGEGYLFSFPEDKDSGAYNAPTGRDQFYISNFGYRKKNGKLTKPEADVDSSVMERQFHENMKKSGALFGRALEVERDYDRKFLIAESAIGTKIDEALSFLREAENGKFMPLYELVYKKFDYLSRMRLLEAIKAEAAIPYIKKSLALRRKVVVFHDYNEGGGSSPFDMQFEAGQKFDTQVGGKPMSIDASALYNQFVDANPYVKDLNFGHYRSPIDAIQAEFPDALIYNGTVPNKKRDEAKRLFNDDNSGRDIIVVQSAAGEAGISLHDTTGRKQRVLLNLGMPVRPTTALQEEGRIYRVGQKSDAMFRYMNTGTNWERWTFGSKIAERSSTAENLAMGDQARAIRTSFIDAFNAADDYAPEPGEGKGGKQIDRAMNNALSEFERAKTHYFANQKLKGRRDQREGIDYFPTPEPLGLKMVEWANVKPGEKILEPSAGHGAIARYFPETTARTLVEPSSELASKASLNSPGARVVVSRFEDLDIVNKYDAIVMNPPFGSGGKTAIDHLRKATKHLKNGGRIVALLPDGGTAATRLAAFYDSEYAKDLQIVGEVALPGITFERAGTSVSAKVIILEKQTDKEIQKELRASAPRDLRNAETIKEFFDRIENITYDPRLEPKSKEIEIPTEGEVTVDGLTFNLNGSEGGNLYADLKTYDRARFGKIARLAEANGGFWLRSVKAFAFKTVKERATFLEQLANPPKEAEPTAAVPAAGGSYKFKTAETTHSITKAKLFVATLDAKVSSEEYQRINAVAKKHGGYYSSFRGRGAIPGFQFPSEDARIQFMAEMQGPSQTPLASAPRRQAPLSSAPRGQSGASFAAEVMAELAQNDKLFQNPVSASSTLEKVIADIAPDIESRGRFMLSEADRKNGVVSKKRFLNEDGYDFFVLEDGDRQVWIDISGFATGMRGSGIYAAVANYAHNAGKVFIGDPAGLSDDALYRRTEAMLSSALKFGTTRHIEPHPRQLQGAPEIGVPPLKWTYGNDADNVASLIEASTANLLNAIPEFADVRYDFSTRTFRDAAGRPLSDETFDQWRVAASRAGKARAGNTTLRRGILLNTLSRAASGDRPRLLEQTLRFQRSLVESGGLKGLLYSAPKAPTFYSGLLRAVEGMKQEKAPKTQWMGMIRNAPGVKPEELQWIGLEDWLNQQNAAITKQQLIDFIKANQIEVTDVTKGQGLKYTEADIQKQIDDAIEEEIQNVLDGMSEDDVYAVQSFYTARDEDEDGNEVWKVYDGNDSEVDSFPTEEEADAEALRLDEIALEDRRIDMRRAAEDRVDYREIEDRIRMEAQADMEQDDETQYSRYQLPGGENYRELLLTLPDAEERVKGDPYHVVRDKVLKPAMQKAGITPHGEDYLRRYALRQYQTVEMSPNEIRAAEEMIGKLEAAGEGEAWRKYRESFKVNNQIDKERRNDFRSGHWQEKNVVAHIRFNERVVDGKRVLFIEEIQSDWHQKGRKYGYRGPNDGRPKEEIWQDFLEALKRDDNLGFDSAAEAANAVLKHRDDFTERWEISPSVEQFAREYIAAKGRNVAVEDMVPDGPFKTTWPEMAMKRMIRYAAENGFDRVAWLPGEEQASRYDLSRDVKRIGWKPTEMFDGTQVTIDLNNGGVLNFTVNGDGRVTKIAKASFAEQFKDKHIDDVVGKEIGDKILTNNRGELTGDGLKIGGRGMKAFYDKILVDVANKLGKKFGSKVGKISLDRENESPSDSEVMQWHDISRNLWDSLSYREKGRLKAEYLQQVGGRQVPSFDITPEMRAAAMQGQPLFKKGAKTAIPNTSPSIIEKPKLGQNPYQFVLGKNQAKVLIHEVRLAAQRILGKHLVSVDIYEKMPNGQNPHFDPNTEIIKMALKCHDDPRLTLRHEAVHLLRQAGVMSSHEWSILSRQAAARWINQYDIRERYEQMYRESMDITPDQLEELLLEEAIADAFAEYWVGDGRGEDVVSRIFYKLKQFLEAVANLARGHGFKTADSIMSAIESGDVGNRERGSGQDRGFVMYAKQQSRPQAKLYNTPADDGGGARTTFAASATTTTVEEDRVLEEFAGNINLNYIDGPESLKDVLRDASNQADGFMGARRGVVSHDQTRMLAEQMGMTVRQLLSRRKGQAFNAHEAFAARAMLVKSGELVKQAAARVQRTRSDVDRAYFMRMVTRHAAIQEQVAGMTAEAGRALNQFRMMAGADYLRSITEALNERSINGAIGTNGVDDLAGMVDSMEQPAQVATMTRAVYRPNFLDKIREFYINSLLSGPSTQTVNLMSNLLTAVNQIPEQFLAEQIGKLHGGEKVEKGEAIAKAVGLLEGSREGLRLAWATLKTGEQHTPETQFDQRTGKAISGLKGEIIRMPSRLMMSSDDFFKAVNYRAELNALAVRMATREGLEGQALAARIQELRDNPTDQMISKAQENARYQTFQNKLGPKGQILMRFREAWHLWPVLPFLRTPINILKYATERTPLGPLLMKDARDRLTGKRGRVAQDIQISRMVLGTLVMAGMASMVLQGMVTGGGPDDEKEKSVKRATGWQPYSFQIGNGYYSYLRFDPFALHLGIVADMIELRDKVKEGDHAQVGWNILASIIGNIADKTWLRSATQFTEMVNDPQRYVSNFVGNLVTGFVPNFSAQVARANDPSFRDTKDGDAWQELLNRFKERIPGYKETLPQRFDIFGEPIKGEGNLGPDLFSPVYVSTKKDNPIAKALIEAQYFPGQPRRHINGHDLTPEQYAEYTEMAGKEAVRRLTRIVQADSWSRRSQDSQEKVLKLGFDQARELARNKLMAKYPELRKKPAPTP